MSTVKVLNVAREQLTKDFEEIFRQHYLLDYRTAYSVTGSPQDAEDVLQNVFLWLLRNGIPPALKEPKAYLYRAAVNASLNVVRARRTESLNEETAAPEVGVREGTGAADAQRRLVDAVASQETAACVLYIRRQVMKHDENVEAFLKQSLPSASQAQAEAAGSRVFERLQADPGSLPNPAVMGDFEISRASGWRWVPAMAAAAAIVIAFAWSGVAPWGTQRIARSTQASGATFTLEDGSRVEMRAQSALSIERSDDGIRVRLEKGSLIVNAAKQQAGRHLYVQTRDVTVTVVGTVFLVNAEEEGSRVAVIEGEVRVQQQQGAEKKLLPGEQLATSKAIPKAFVEEQIEWSKNAKAHLVMLEQSATATIQAASQAQSSTRPADTPKWEAVSIRPCGDPTNEPGVRAGGVGFRPGLLRVTCMRLRFLIEDAYVKHLEPELMRRRWIFPVEGGPSWLDTELYTIEARAEGLPSRQQLGGPMLQVLLEDRFKLKLRREIREEPVYELQVADSGFKLQPLKEGECEARKARSDAETAALPADASIDAMLRASFGECGSVGIGGPRDGSPAIEGTRTVKLTGLKVAELSNYLSLDRIILDKTGLQGLYDLDVTYGIYNSPMREPQPIPPGMAPGGDPIFTALEKQLGLKLVRAIGPRTYYFVESVDRPTPN